MTEVNHGEPVSTPWLQTGAHRLTSDGLEKFISCCATVAACCLSASNEEAEAWGKLLPFVLSPLFHIGPHVSVCMCVLFVSSLFERKELKDNLFE